MDQIYTLLNDRWVIVPGGILPEWAEHRHPAWEDTVAESDRASGFNRFVSWAIGRRALGYTVFALRVSDTQAHVWEA